MPEKDVLFSVTLPDGTKTTLDQEQYTQAQDKLFSKFPDAQVSRVQSYVRDDDDQNDTDSYHVQLPDGTSTTLDASQFAANRQRLQEKFPDAQIARISDMSDRYWRPKLDEAKAALDAFDTEHGAYMTQYENYEMLANNAEQGEYPNYNSVSHKWLKEHGADYKPLKEQRDALRQAVYNNPIVGRGRRQAYDQAMSLRNKYLQLAEKATTREEKNDYKRAAKLQGDAGELFSAPGQYDKIEGKNGFQKYIEDYKAGAVNTFSDRDFLTRGITQIARDLDLRGIQKKVQDEEKRKGAPLDEKDFDRILSASEKAELLSFHNLAVAQMDDVIGRANDLSSAYKAGQTAAESTGFMAEFLLSQGLANIAGKALSASSNGLSRWLGQALMSEKALNRAVNMGVTTIPQMSKAGKVGTELARPVIQGLWHTGTQLSTLSNVASMLNQTDDQGELNSVGRGIWLGLADSFVENWSESLGNTMDKGFERGLEWAGNKLGASAIGKSSFGRMARWAYNSNFNQTLKEAGFNGFVGEMLEEWAGNAVRLGTGLMDKDEFKQFASVEQQLEMAASFAPMSLFGLGGNVTSAVRHRKEYNRLTDKVKGILVANNVDQAKIDDLFNTRFDTGEDVAKKLAPYAREVLNSGKESAKEDYKTILQFAEEAGVNAFNEATKEIESQGRRDQVRDAIASQTGQFWQDYSPVEEGGAPVQAVHIVRYADGTRKYIVGGEGISDSGNRMYATVDEKGNKGFIDDVQIRNGLEDGTITANEEMGLNEYLQEQVDAVDKNVEAQRMQKEAAEQLNAIRARINENPSFNMGTPEQPNMATVVPATINEAGATVEVDRGEGHTVEAQLSWKEIGEYLGMPIDVKTDAQLQEEAAIAAQQTIERKDKYNQIPAGTEIIVSMPGAEGDEQVPYRFAKAIYDENEDSVRIYVADENGNIMTGRDGEEVWFPEEMVPGLDAVADAAIQQANAPVEESPEQEETPEEVVEAPVVKYTNADGKVNQTAFFKNEPEEWAKWNDARRNDAGANSKERLAASISELEKEITELNKKKAATANPDDAEALEEQVNDLGSRYASLKSIYDQYIAIEQAAKAAEDEAKRAEFEAAAAAKKEAEQKAAAKIQDDLKEDASFVELAENYAAQPKTYGDTDTYNVGGRKFKGRWVVAEATTPKPSHNPLADFAPTPGYPIGKAGNSNHYDKDKRAQEITREMSNPFDERAVQEPVVVTKHGIVLSGNGRTQARLLAAQQDTDVDYEQYIKEHANKWGLTAEQIGEYENPMLYFELEEDVEYTAALFDAFNRSTSKQQSATETAAKVAQMTSEELVMRLDRLFREIGDSLDNLYKNPEQVNELLNMLQAAGIFNANERARYVDEYGNLSGAGEDLVESVLFGTVFSSSDESVRAAMNDKSIRRAVAFAFPTLVRLRNLNGELSLIQELTEAVSLVAAAKAANGGKAENAIIDYMLQGDLFTGETPIVKATVQLLGHVLNDGKYGSLRAVLNQYIDRAEAANYGQAIFTDEGTVEVENKERILRDVLAHNKINIETYGNTESAGQPGVSENDEVRPASGEQGSSGPGADGQREEDLEGVPGEGSPSEPVDLLQVAKEQATKNRIAKKLQKRITKWQKFLGKEAFDVATGIEDIEKIEDEATREQVLQRQQQNGDVEGWFANGKAVIFLPNIPDERMLDRKIMHEVIAHKGIKGLFEGKGKGKFNEFLDMVWGELMNDAVRSKYLNYPGVVELKDLKAKQRAAADEFLAHCAENETAVIGELDETFWDKLVAALKNLINDAMGEDVFQDEEDGWFADLLKQAAQSVQQESAAREEEDNTLFSIQETDTITNEMPEGNVLFSVGDGDLVGLHNISEKKLKSAIRTGGLANPSLAVIDVDNMIHEDYGDISLIAPSSLIDTRKGRNAGTYNGDAWTPTYPGVRKQMSDKGWDKFYDQVRVLPEPFSHQVRNDWREYLDDDRMGRSLKWWFLQDTGRNPDTVYNTSNLSDEDKELVRSFSGKKIFGTDEDASKAIEMFRRLADPEEVERAGRKIEIKEGKSGRYRDWAIARNEDIDSWGIFTAPVVDFIEELQRQVRYEGTIAELSTYQSAEDFVRDNNLDGEFQQWLQDKEKEFGVKEVLFAGWTPDGDRKYVPNTVENASRLMNKEPDQNAYGNGGLSATRSLLLERMDTLEEIRKNRGQLADIRGYASETPEYEAASSNWFNVIESLANMQKISDNQFSNIDYAEARLQEAIQERNPIAYLNKEYRYHIPEGGEFEEALKASVKEIKNLPAKYFETKFNRPVYLNEFAAAVIPTYTSKGVREELERAGVPVYEYDSKKEGSRQEAVLQASQVDGVRFSVGDYQSGEAQEQYRQQLENTPEFKEWFNGSKVVDENGNPLVVYRGATFDPLAMADGLGVIKPQAYFSPSEEYARRYGPWTRSYYLNIQNPFDIRNKKDLEIYKKMLPDGYVIAKTGSGAADWAEFGATIDIDTLMDNHPEYDGIILDEGGDPDGNGGVTSRGVSYIPLRGGAQVKSAEANNGQFSSENPDVRFSVITPEQDAEYMQAVESGDMEKARQMVDAAAKASGFTVKGYHGTILRKYDTEYMEFPQEKPFTVFHTDNQMGAHFGYSRRQAENRASDLEREDAGWIDEEYIYATWLKLDNPALIDDIRNFNDFQRVRDSLVENDVITEDEARYVWNNKSITDLLKSKGYDGLVYTNDYEGRGPSYVVFDANQIKSAEPVTVDNDGEVIPLSQRFNEDNEDIRFSVRRYHNFATAQLENKVPGKEYPELEDASVRFSLSKNNRATVEAWLRKRGDLTDEQRQAVVDYLDTMNNPTLQLATAKWFSQGVIRLPEDMDKVEQAVSVAGKAKVDPLQYGSPMELLDAHAGFEASEKRINPDDVPTLHKVKEFKDHGIVIYDVDDSEESRQNMRKIINTHFGKEASPWCLLQGDGNGKLTRESGSYWRSYNAYPKQVAFINGKLLAFSANDTNRVVWWDRQDKPYEGIPVTRKMAGDELGRSATYTLDADGLLSNPTDIHRGNKQNGTYEEWNDKDIITIRRHYQNGKLNGLQEAFYDGGEPLLREETKDGLSVGEYINWYQNGQVQREIHFNENGLPDGVNKEFFPDGSLSYSCKYVNGKREGLEERWSQKGKLASRVNYHNGKHDGLAETWGENGPQSYIEYKDGKRNGVYKVWHWNGQPAREATYKDDALVGEVRTYYESGNLNRIQHFGENGGAEGLMEGFYDLVDKTQIAERVNYKSGLMDGPYEKWHMNGQLSERVNYVNGVREGLSEKWYENGILGEIATYKGGVLDGIVERWDSGGRLWYRSLYKDGHEIRSFGNGGPSWYETGESARFSIVTDEKEIERLEKEPTVTLYRAMELVDGKLYPPMSQKVPNAKEDKGKKMQRREGVVPGMWQKADEDPSKAYQKVDGGPWYYDLKKNSGSDVNGVLYNPYIHLSASPLNDQFTSASSRPNLVIVACEVPISELTSGYKADKANDSVGAKDWHSGTVTAQLGEGRQVVLSRWAKIGRIVPDAEVADMVAPKLVEKDIVVPANVVTPSLRAALEARGVKFAEPESDVRFSVEDLEHDDMLHAWGMDIESYEKRFREADSIEGKEAVLRDYAERVKTPDIDIDFTSTENLKGFLMGHGLSDEQAQAYVDVYSNRPRLFGEYNPKADIAFFLVDRVPNVSALRDGIVHEREHRRTRGEGRGSELLRRLSNAFGLHVSPDVALNEMTIAARALGMDVDSYIDDSAPIMQKIGILADEIISYGMQRKYSDKDFENTLKKSNIAKDAIKLINDLYNEGRRTIISRVEPDDGLLYDGVSESARGGDLESLEGSQPGTVQERPDQGADDDGHRRGIEEGNKVRFAVANRNQEIFVSNAERAAESIKMDKATPTQWIAMLEKAGGLKSGEDKWLGLSDWLKSQDKKTISKQEIVDYINEHKIRIEESRYAGDPESVMQDDISERIGRGNSLQQIQDQIYTELRLAGDELEGWDQSEIDNWLTEQMVERYGDDFTLGYSITDGEVSYNTDDYSVDDFVENTFDSEDVKPINRTRYGLTTEGLKNKREIALTIPTVEPWNETDMIHFGDAGNGRAIAWIRFGDAVRGNGEKVLFIDEIQSKRHQEGREKGYRDDKALEKKVRELGEKRKALFDELRDISKRQQEIYAEMTEEAKKKGIVGEDGMLVYGREAEYRQMETENEELQSLSKRWQDVYRERKEIDREVGDIRNDAAGAIPGAPFEKNWHELAMKRMLRLAAEEGYDYVAWTTGEQQAERYNLSQAVSEIAVKADNDGKYRVVIEDKYGTELEEYRGSGRVMTAEELSQLVGKELATRLITGAEASRGLEWKDGQKYNPEYFTIRGEDLNIGGEGMKGFYDEILPRFMNKYGKKWGVSVEDIEIPNIGIKDNDGMTVHAVPFTDEMKESVMQGQVMFSVREAERAREDGIAGVIGPENVRDFYMELYGAIPAEMRKEVVDNAMNGDMNFVEAMSEYVSGLAAKGYENDDTGLLLVAESLLNSYAEDYINPNAAQYILWRGNHGVDENDLLSVASDRFMWNYLKVEDEPEGPDDTPDGPGRGSIEAAREEVDTNPSDAQKEAGNYKKGHVSIDGYNISLENPKGSVRSGKDASGKEWSVTMNNDYGYIRLTEGVDGDHIDVFLSDNPEQGDVYVVDQVDPKTGEFDEHKVMYGFDSIEQAREAYLANYSEGWKGLGAITGVTKDEFKKWIDSSHRKTKPFADYKSVRFSVAESVSEAEGEAAAVVDAAKEKLAAEKKELSDLLTVAKSMGLQKEYDKKTVEAVANLAKRLLRDQYIEEMSRREVSRLLGIIRTSVGKAPKTVKKNADTIVEMVIDHLLKREKAGLDALSKVVGTKTSASGVTVKGELDINGQKILKYYRDATKKVVYTVDEEGEKRINTTPIDVALADAYDDLNSNDNTVKVEAEARIAGLELAKDYLQTIQSLNDVEDSLEEQRKELDKDYKNGDISKTDYSECVIENDAALRRNRIDLIEALREHRAKLQGVISGSKDALKAQRDAEKARIEHIHHLANSDMEGVPTDKPGDRKSLLNKNLFQTVMGPLVTFNQFFRLFGRKNAYGRGYLYNWFVTKQRESQDDETIGLENAREAVNAKVAELLGEGKNYDDIKRYAAQVDRDNKRDGREVKMTFLASGGRKEHVLDQAQLMYIYMVNKMSDGRMKLRRMGITQEMVDAIVPRIDSKLVQFADWAQEQFLVELRNKYNAVYERMWGASMAAIENYFPLKIDKRDLEKTEDIASDPLSPLPSTTTGAIIKRTVNNRALDLLNADALDILNDHLLEMEHWAAFAEYIKDVNTLISYRRFHNQVTSMKTVYGTGEPLWKNFRDVLSISIGNYHPTPSKADKFMTNSSRAFSVAKVSFRISTAIKQLASITAFIPEVSVKNMAIAFSNPMEDWKWAMDNMPSFRARLNMQNMGNEKLLPVDSDLRDWTDGIVRWLQKVGMAPNKFIDALTISVGSRAVYLTKKEEYIKLGYSEEESEKRAIHDAETVFNETQQSSEGGFLAPIQRARDFWSTTFSMFRNSSFSYTRKAYNSIRALSRMLKDKEGTMAFMTKQFVRDGFSEEQAAKNAERQYNRAKIYHAATIATNFWINTLFWNLFGHLWYYLFGDDDDKKIAYLEEDVKRALVGGPIEGLAGGNVISQMLGNLALKENMFKYSPSLNPLLSDAQEMFSTFKKDSVKGVNDLVNLGAQIITGVNPQTFTDIIVAIVDACDGDLDTAKEAMILMMRVIQAPQSQIDEVYIDELGMRGSEAKRMSYQQFARRYAEYKVNREAPLTGWAYSEEERKKKLKSKERTFKSKVNDRKELKKK